MLLGAAEGWRSIQFFEYMHAFNTKKKTLYDATTQESINTGLNPLALKRFRSLLLAFISCLNAGVAKKTREKREDFFQGLALNGSHWNEVLLLTVA